MKPYTEVYDRWSYLDAELPNAAVGGYPGAVVFAGDGPNSCGCRTPIKTYYGAVGPRIGLAYSVSSRMVLRGAYGINYSRRGAVGGRAGARNGTGTLGLSANFPSAKGFDPLQLEQRSGDIRRRRLRPPPQRRLRRRARNGRQQRPGSRISSTRGSSCSETC